MTVQEEGSQSLIDLLVKEHDEILRMLRVLEVIVSHSLNASVLVDLKDVIEYLITVVEKLHHEKEEKILFPFLNSTNALQAGGPNCSLFMQIFLEKQTFAEVFKFAETAGISPIQISREAQNLINANSPLTIPLKEHHAGQYLIELMKSKLISKGSLGEEDNRELKSFILRYIEMLRLHIRKENECLFIVARAALPHSDAFVAKIQSIDESIGEEKQSWCKNLLFRLEEKYLLHNTDKSTKNSSH